MDKKLTTLRTHRRPIETTPIGGIWGHEAEAVRDALIERQRRITSIVQVAVRLGGESWSFYLHDRASGVQHVRRTAPGRAA